jgi:hypothetical protein
MPTSTPHAAIEARRRIALEHRHIIGNLDGANPGAADMLIQPRIFGAPDAEFGSGRHR